MFARLRPVLVSVYVAGLSVLLGACGPSKLLSQPATWLTPYRPDVVQGNFISSEQVALLTAGLSRLQVRNLLGTPLVSSLFHADRWDYVFSIQRRVGESQIYRYAVFFKGDELVRYEGDSMPTESDFIAQLNVRRELGKVLPMEATAEQLQASEAKAPARSSEPAATATPSAATAYPPLEESRQ